jgi:hypothetical protein
VGGDDNTASQAPTPNVVIPDGGTLDVTVPPRDAAPTPGPDANAPDTSDGSVEDATGPDVVDATVEDAADATSPDAADAAPEAAPDSSAGDASDASVVDASAEDAAVEDASDAATADASDATIADASGDDAGDGGVADATIDSPVVVDAAPDAPGVDASDAAPPDASVVVDCTPAPVAQPPTPLSGRVFGAYSYQATTLPIYDLTDFDGGALTTFATLNAGGWIGPLVTTTSGRLFAATGASNGSIYEVSAGGDQTDASALASSIFADGGYSEIDSMAIDGNGNLYLTNSEAGLKQVAVVSPSGAVSFLPRLYDNPTGLAVCGNALLISEGNAGRIVAHDLTTNAESDFATGFTPGGSHISAQLVVDHRGHLLVLWLATGGGSTEGLYDVTGGGDFTNQAPLVAAPFRIDVNQIAVNAANDVFAAGNNTGDTYVSRFGTDAGVDGGLYAPFVVYATGLTDTESVAVGP